MMIMAQHPQSKPLASQKHQQAQQRQPHHDSSNHPKEHFNDNHKTLATNHHFMSILPESSAQAEIQPQSGAPESTILELKHSCNDQGNYEDVILRNETTSSDTHLDIANDRQHQDGKRTLIKNQFCLIEQLQLENANLRNERDQLQLENEELKFQLQMISSSNILAQSGGPFCNADDRHQLGHSNVDGCSTTTKAFERGDNRRSAITNNPAELTACNVTASNALGRNYERNSKTVTSESSLNRIADTPVRQPIRLLNGLLGHGQLRSTTTQVTNEQLRSRAKNRESNSGNNVAIGCRRATSSGDLVAASKMSNATTKTTSMGTTTSRFLSNKSSSTVLFDGDSLKNSVPELNSRLISSEANQDSDDGENALKLVCHRLNINDGKKAVTAAVIIQRAFRKYQICKRFRIITEQLRHTCKSSQQVIISTSTTENQFRDTENRTYASGTTRAAAWESLSYAASRLAASAAAKQAQLLQQNRSTVNKSSSSQQVNRLESRRNAPTGTGASQRSTSATPSLTDGAPRNAISSTTEDMNGANSRIQLRSSDPSVVAAALNFQQLESLRKRQYRVGLNIFNKSPEKGVSFLIAHSFIDCSSPLTKSSTSYYLANQLHFIDKQNLAQQQAIQAQQDMLANSNYQLDLKQQQKCQLCRDEENLKRNVAHFLLHRKGLAKEKIGQYLGNLQAQFNQDVLKYYLQELDFTGLQIDIALRKFSSTVRMPGEAQKIERFVDCFAQRYVQCQQQQAGAANLAPLNLSTNISNDQTPLKSSSALRGTSNNSSSKQQNGTQTKNSNLTLLSRDEIFILTFAIIMLNTDLHSPSLKSQARMSGQQFINNLRGVFKSQTISESDLMEIYERVKVSQITTAPDHVTHVLKVQQGLTMNNFQKKDSIPNLCVPHRRLVCFCRLFEVYDIAKKERAGQHQREIFLFNDLLLVTKIARRARANTPQQYTYRQSIPLYGLYVQLFQSTHYNFGIKLCRRSNDEILIMFNARNELDQSRFVDDLSESIAEMEEMEIIRSHNIVETIHFKHQDQLKRHAMIHQLQAANLNQAPSDKLSNGLSMVAFNAQKRTISSERLVIIEDKDEESSKEPEKDVMNDRKNSLVSSENKPGSRAFRSKFSSMTNLSTVTEGTTVIENEENLKSSEAKEESFPKLGLRENMADAQPLKSLKTVTRNSAEQPSRGLHLKAPVHSYRHTDQLGGNQRSNSSVSVHSLDSGLFLSRDVSPNQSG